MFQLEATVDRGIFIHTFRDRPWSKMRFRHDKWRCDSSPSISELAIFQDMVVANRRIYPFFSPISTLFTLSVQLHRWNNDAMWSETIDPNARAIRPQGFPLTVLILSFVFLALSLLAVGLRTYIRVSKRIFGIDDACLSAGAVS